MLSNITMLLNRSKRRIRSRVSKTGACKGFVTGGQVAGFSSDIANDIGSIPLLGPIASTVMTGFSMITHIFKAGLDIAGTAADCSDTPFDEIKEILDKRFNEVKRKLDENTAVLIQVSKLATRTLKTVERIRTEMNDGFSRIVDMIKNSKIKDVVTQIKNVVQFFGDETRRIEGLPQEDYVVNLERGDFLNFLRDSRTAKSGSLRTSLFEIIDNSYAIPDSADDVMALEALYALYYGTQTYVSVMFFLVKTYSYLADYYYEKGRLEKFNEHFHNMRMTFQNFRHSLVGRDSQTSMIHNVLQLLETVKSKSFFRRKPLIFQRIKTLTKIKKEIESMVLPVILDTPINAIKASFKATDIATPLGDWKAGSKVSYAIQFRNGRAYSKVSEWTHPFEVREKACPYIKLPVDPKRRTRLIFRKFDNGKSQLIGVIDPYQTDFRDVDRDLYNSAGSIHEQTAMNEIRILIQAVANITATFEKGQQAIHSASRQGNVNIAKQFMLNNNNININAEDNDGYTPLHIASENGEEDFVKKLVGKNALINVKTNDKKLSPLHLAARNGFKETVKILIESPFINVNQKDAAGYTPMHSSIMGGYKTIRIFTNNAKVNMNAKSQIGLTPLHLASMYNDKIALETLLQRKKVDVNPIDVNNMTPLHYATLIGNMEVVEYLIADENININAKTKFIEWTPLHYAIFFRKIDVVKVLLISDKIDVNSKAADGVAPLHLATATGQNIMLLNLLSKGASMEQKTNDGFAALHIAALRNEENIAAILIKTGANIFARTNDHSTPLHLAASKGRLQIVRMLIEKGANVDSKNGDGDSPLHLAAMGGHYHVIDYLISQHTNINIRDNNGLLFFYVLIQNGHLNAVKYLVENNKFDVDEIDYLREELGEKRKSIMYWSVCDAVAHGKLELVKYLVGSLNNVLCNPLNNAALRGHLDIVKYLVEGKGMNVDGRSYTAALNVDGTFNPVRTPPLFSAITGNNFEIIKYLVSKHANINIRYHDQNCLLYPILQKDLTMVKFLIKHGADVYFIDKAGKTLLHHCVERQHILAYLVQEKGLNEYSRDNDGNTIMHYVAKYGDEPSIIFLCSLGVDWSIRNNYNKTPYELVLELGKTPVKKCLIPKTTRRNTGVNTITTGELVQPNGKITLHNQEVFRRIGSFRNNKFTDALKSRVKGISLPVKNTNRWKRSGNKLIDSIDVNGVLVLMDVLIRKYTKQNYISTEDVPIPDSDAQVTALNITEKFEKLLNTLSRIPAEEHIDLTQVHRDIVKTITSGKHSKILEILCSYVKELSMQNEQDNLSNVFRQQRH